MNTRSDMVCNKKFPHAAYSIEIVGSTLISELDGQWSTEISNSYIADVKQEVSSKFNKRWLHIVLLDKWDLTTFDAMDKFTEYGIWCYEKGVKATFYVYQTNPVKRYQLAKMLPERAKDYVSFHVLSIDDAFLYASENGFLDEPKPNQTIKTLNV
jgi:hypothetical protein